MGPGAAKIRARIVGRGARGAGRGARGGEQKRGKQVLRACQGLSGRAVTQTK